MEGAWTRNDAEAYAALFADDGDDVAVEGTHPAVRMANAASDGRQFEADPEGGRLIGDKPDIHFLTAAR
ncbi:hypothetical protein BN1110_02489 [bacterium YEK0313]|nr:hypothetical protein BN1110_02489 [bacterium YEK0313]